MPTYSYACTDCGDRSEVVQAFTDDSLTVCPVCTGKLRKVFSSVGIVFKGSGFYRTDSRAGAVPKGESKGEAKGEKTSETKSPEKTGANASSSAPSASSAGGSKDKTSANTAGPSQPRPTGANRSGTPTKGA